MQTEQLPSRPMGCLPNSRFPLLIHRKAVPGGGPKAVIERVRGNGWRHSGIYDYGHFHSTTHECLGVAAGHMKVELFGRGGTWVMVRAGDMVVMPAGVSPA